MMISRATSNYDLRINGVALPTLPHQARFMALNCRNPLLVGGFGCGKTHIGLRKALWGCARNPGLIGIYACLTYPLLRDAILPEMHNILYQLGLEEGIDWSLNRSSMTMTFPIFSDERGTPAAILFRPVEGVQSLGRTRSVTAAWAIMDEAAYMPSEAFLRINERVRDKRARSLFLGAVTTPEGINWVHERWVDGPRKRAAEVGATDWLPGEQFLYVRGRTYDNPNLDTGYVDALKAQYPEELVASYLEGHFIPLFEGRCFRFSEREHVSTTAQYSEFLPIRMAWDFNVSPMSVSLNHYHKGQLWTFDEIVLRSSHTEDVCERFLEKYESHVAGVWIYGDAGGKARSTKARWTDYEIIRQMLGHLHNFEENVPRANPSQRESINTLNALMRNGFGNISYSIHPRCIETIKSLLTTIYDDNGQIYKGEDSYEHLSDGLRYLAWEVSDVAETGQRGAPKRGRREARIVQRV